MFLECCIHSKFDATCKYTDAFNSCEFTDFHALKMLEVLQIIFVFITNLFKLISKQLGMFLECCINSKFDATCKCTDARLYLRHYFNNDFLCFLSFIIFLISSQLTWLALDRLSRSLHSDVCDFDGRFRDATNLIEKCSAVCISCTKMIYVADSLCTEKTSLHFLHQNHACEGFSVY